MFCPPSKVKNVITSTPPVVDEAPTPTPPVDDDTDSSGLKWDERINATTKTKNTINNNTNNNFTLI